VWVPPPHDDESFAIALHEAGHVVVGPCTGGPLHFNRRRATSACLECERLATEQAKRWVPFTPRMTECLRSALKTYRRSVPAPAAALQRADEALGRVSALKQRLARVRFAEREAQLARWRA
jgi:hypothetical protein